MAETNNHKAPAQDWLVTIAQLPVEDPASRMRVLRTLESLGVAVMREGVYLLPDTPGNRRALDALAEYVGKIPGAAHVLRASGVTSAQHEAFMRLFDRSARYEELIKTVKSLRISFGHSDPSAISRVMHKQRRDFEAIAALDFFPSAAPAHSRGREACALPLRPRRERPLRVRAPRSGKNRAPRSPRNRAAACA
jgi:hypothetical protein